MRLMSTPRAEPGVMPMTRISSMAAGFSAAFAICDVEKVAENDRPSASLMQLFNLLLASNSEFLNSLIKDDTNRLSGSSKKF